MLYEDACHACLERPDYDGFPYYDCRYRVCGGDTVSEALLSSSDRNKIINNLMGIEYAALKPAEKLALDIHNTGSASDRRY